MPGAGGEGSGEGGDEARQEAEGVLPGETKVDEGQNNPPVDDVTQDGGKDVLS